MSSAVHKSPQVGATLCGKITRILLAVVLVLGLCPGLSYADESLGGSGFDAVELAQEEEGLQVDPQATEPGFDEGTYQTEDIAPRAFSLEGSGTEASPYLIKSADDWAVFASAVNGSENSTYGDKYYQLANDIDLSSLSSQSAVGARVNYSYRYFEGRFDGAGYTIKGLNISSTSNYQGLFGYSYGATIENFTLEGSVSAANYVGAVVGFAGSNTTISNVTNKANVTGTGSGSYYYAEVGGIAGELSGTMSNCSNEGSVTANYSGSSTSTSGKYHTVGGIVGALASGSVTSCFNTGSVTSAALRTGGITGYASVSSSQVKITDCYNTGAVTFTGAYTDAINYVSGILGFLDLSWFNYNSNGYLSNFYLQNCYSTGMLKSTNLGEGATEYNCGIIAGCGIKNYDDDTYNVPADKYPNIKNNYYLEGSATHAMRMQVGGTFLDSTAGVAESKTDADLKADGFAATLGSAYADDTASTYNNGYPYLRWQNPNATYGASLSVSLSNEYNEDASNAISVVIKDAEGNDVTSQFTADSTNDSKTASWAKDNIANGTRYTYTVSKKGYNDASGALSINKGSASASVTLEPTAYTYTLNVTPADANVTFKSDGKTLTGEKSTGADGATAVYVYSGLYNNNKLEYSAETFGYESTSVSDKSVSFENGSDTINLTQFANYDVTFNVQDPAAVDAGATTEGLDLSQTSDLPEYVVQTLDTLDETSTEGSAPVVLVYYKNETSSYNNRLVYDSRNDATVPTTPTNGVYTIVAKGMLDKSTFAYVAYAKGHPVVQGEVALDGAAKAVDVKFGEYSTATTWDGTSVDTEWYLADKDATEYHISTAAQLAGLSALVGGAVQYDGTTLDAVGFSGKTIYLDADIDLGGTAATPCYWTPIGNYNGSKAFKGTFDGQSHTIKNLLVGKGDTARLHKQNTSAAFFSSVEGTSESHAAIKNVTFENPVISDDSGEYGSGYRAAVVVGQAVKLDLSNVNVTGDNASITSSSSDRQYMGGLIALISSDYDSDDYVTISDCSSSAKISTGTASKVGGLVGDASACKTTIERSFNMGSITSTVSGKSSSMGAALGGLIGQGGSSYGLEINESFNTGAITGSVTSVGGLVGYLNMGSASKTYLVSNSYNMGAVQNTSTTASSTYAVHAGGIVGAAKLPSSSDASTHLKNCYSAASVSFGDGAPSAAYVGGIIGAAPKTSSWSSAYPLKESNLSNNWYATDVEGAPADAIGFNASASGDKTFSGGAEGTTSATMKAVDFATTLGASFAADSGEQLYNEGYPYLRWQDPNAKWAIGFNMVMDTAANDDFVVEEADDGTLKVTQEGTLPTVTLKDSSGDVVEDANAVVKFVPTTGNNGTIVHKYQVAFEVDNGTYTYEISKQGYNETQGDDGTYTSSTTGTVVVVNSSASKDIDLTATKYVYKLAVQDADGNALPDAQVTFADAAGTAYTADNFDKESATYTYKVYNGNYTISGLLYGYGAPVASDSVSYGDASGVLAMNKAATHKLTIVATPSAGSFADGQASLGLSCATKAFDNVVGTADENGKVTFEVEVAEGIYNFTVRSGGFKSVAVNNVTVTADTRQEVTLEKLEGWDGTSTDITWYTQNPSATEFHVSNALELAGFAQLVNGTAVDDSGTALSAETFAGKTVYLDANINLGDSQQWASIGSFKGYGSSGSHSFAGTFDGQGYAINGLYQTIAASDANGGLFGNAAGATFKDFTVSGNIQGSTTYQLPNIAGVVGYSTAGITFENVGNNVAITLSCDNNYPHIGGLVGWSIGAVNISGCYNKADINVGGASGSVYAAGFVGMTAAKTTISASYSTGTVAASTTNTSSNVDVCVAGLVGAVNSSTLDISNTYVSGAATGTIDGAASSEVGLFIGSNSSSSSSIASNCFYLSDLNIAAAGEFGGANSAVAKTADALKSAAGVTGLNEGLADSNATFLENKAGGFPLLSWERVIVSVESVSGPTKMDYNDMQNFSDAGIQLKVTYASGDPQVVTSGWTVVDGANLKPGQETVTIDYNGYKFTYDITVTQVTHETIGDISVSLAGPVEGANVAPASVTSKQDGTYSVNTEWTCAGQPVAGAFEAGKFYRAKIRVSTTWQDGVAWYVLPSNVSVSVAAADGTPEPLEVLYAQPTTNESGAITGYELECTYAALGATDTMPQAYHTYYEGDNNASVYSKPLAAEKVLTLVADGEEIPFNLAQIENAALTGSAAAFEGTYSNTVDGNYSSTTYTGISLYRLINDNAPAKVGDETEVTLISKSGEKTTLTMGDLRQARNTYSEKGATIASVPWLVAFGANGAPLEAASLVNKASGPLMVVSGQSKAGEAAVAQNITRIELGEIQTAATRIVSFTANCEGTAINNLDIAVTDSYGNAVAVQNNRCSIFAGEEYSYTVKATSYSSAVGTIAAGEGDTTVELTLNRVYNGSYTDNDKPSIDDSGTYLISTPEELMWWANNAQSTDNVKLLKDIALNDGSTFDSSSNTWPVKVFGSTEDSAYGGTFDGNGHTISGFYINRENTIDLWLNYDGSVGMLSDRVAQLGMFGYATDATIKNLGVDGRIDVIDRPDSMYGDWLQAGAIVGYGTRVTIENCTANIGITHVQGNSGGSLGGVSYDGFPQVQDACVGGIIGTAANSTIKNCYSRGELKSSGSRTNNVGGVVGRAHQYSETTTIRDCYSTAKVYAKPAWGSDTQISYQGGIVGEVSSSSISSTTPRITNCVALNSAIDGGSSTWSVAHRVAGQDGARYTNNYAVTSLDITNASTPESADCNGADISVSASTARSTYVDKATWTENTSREVTATSTGWQFVTDRAPLLYWEDSAATQTPDQGSNTLNPGDGDGDDSGTVFSEYAPPATFDISVQVGSHDAQVFRTYTSEELLHMVNKDKVKFSGIRYGNPYGRVATESIAIKDLLADAGLSFGSGDSIDMGLTYDYDTYFGSDLYYYPHWADDTTPNASEAVKVDTSIVLKSFGGSMYYGDDGDAELDYYASRADYLYAYMIAFGQKSPTDSNVGGFTHQQTGMTLVYDGNGKANSYVDDLLSDAIKQAIADKNATATGALASEVSKGTTFVTPEVMQAFAAAIEVARTAESTVAAGTATNESIMAAYEALQSAQATFDKAKQEGSKGVDFNGLEKAIDLGNDFAAEVVSGEIVVSSNGDNLTSWQKWVNPSVYNNLVQALDAAKAVDGDAYATQADVDYAEQQLMTFVQAFEDAISTGTANLANAEVEAIADQPYTGTAIEPELKVTLNGKELVAGSDYTAAYQNNIEPGTALVIITGAGGYSGTLTTSFKITKEPEPAPADKSELSYELGTANAVLGGVKVSADGRDVPAGDKWVPQEAVDALKSAIAKAQDVAGNSDATQEDVDAAVEELKAAVETFVAAEKSGTKGTELKVTRLFGTDRYKTMDAIVGEGFAHADVAILATGDNFPDALAASALAGVNGAPVILTDSNSLSAEAQAELVRLGVKSVYVLGGTSAVSEAAVQEVQALGITAQRVSGDSRQATSLAVYNEVIAANATCDTVIVAAGKGFADALSISPYAYAEGTPVLLTDNDGNLTSDEVAAIKANANIKNIVIVGGTGVVSDNVKAQLGASAYAFERLSGDNRYETSAAIAKWELAHGLNATSAAIATGTNFPDALAGAALSGAKGSILLLADDSNYDQATGVLSAQSGLVTTLYVYGGTGAVPDAVKDSCAAAAAGVIG